MQRIASFEKVSFAQFKQAWENTFADTEAEVQEIYDDIKIPCRATTGSAGYDFFSPLNLTLSREDTVLIPTGIRVKIEEGWFLALFPRSGLGFKYRLQLDNTVGIVDSDYYFSDNEGHIFIKVTCDCKQNKVLELHKGDAFAQGIFLPFGLTMDDKATAKRNGGMGSTSK